MMTSSNGNIFRVTGPLCGEFTGPGEFPTQRPVTRSFDVFFDLRLDKRLSKQLWGWWLETPSWSLWRQCNIMVGCLPAPSYSLNQWWLNITKVQWHYLRAILQRINQRNELNFRYLKFPPYLPNIKEFEVKVWHVASASCGKLCIHSFRHDASQCNYIHSRVSMTRRISGHPSVKQSMMPRGLWKT